MEDAVFTSPSISVATNRSFCMSFSEVLKCVKWGIHLPFNFTENAKLFFYMKKRLNS